MIRLIKCLSFYPVVLIGGFLLLVTRTFGWTCLIGFVLVGGFRLGETLAVSGWIVASLLAAGVIALIVAELFVEILARLNLAEGHGPVGGRCVNRR